jgi:type II secretory ATPase GspE/PulE/Tfp pilus assembly ATPase PilB-like protein
MSDQQNLSGVAKDIYRNGLEEEVKSRAAKLDYGYSDLRKTHIPNEALTYLSKDEVVQYKAIPLKTESGILFLGISDPEKELSTLIEDLRNDYKLKEVKLVLISETSYLEWLPRFNNLEKMTPLKEEDENIDLSEVKEIPSFKELANQLQNAPIQDLLKMIMIVGFNVGASDIHIEPHDDWARIRYRLDGTLHEVATLTKERFKYVLSQVELHSNLKLNVNYPQNGRFSIKLKDRDVGVRIETMPSMHGEDIVLRLFNIQADMLKINDLGFAKYDEPLLKSALIRPHGMLLVVGPTGAGKTSTIYSILNELNSEDVKIITLEDPVEYEMPGTTQSQINEGESFAERLKAVLREDPDIIMVGEIRDSATAQTALQAALTGHLLISTLHANDAVTAVIRLSDMIGDPTLVTASTNLIIAQRLVRKICPDCKGEYQPNQYEQREFEKIIGSLPEELKLQPPYKFYQGVGCPKCNQIGFKGRTGIFELLVLNNDLQKLINEDSSIFETQEAAKKAGMITMEQDGILKALAGITPLSEVLKTVKE